MHPTPPHLNAICWLVALFLYFPFFLQGQTVIEDDFEGNGTITTWVGDDCHISTDFTNPYPTGINPSHKVLEYHDVGGQFANARFDITGNFAFGAAKKITFKLYVPSSGLTGNQNNQVSVKLQNRFLPAPWSTQSEIIQSITLDQWQELTFDFAHDPYINLDPNSPAPTQRRDFNRVVIQINGESNTDQVLAYIDEVKYDGENARIPTYDYLVWSDEFDTDGPVDNTKWFQQSILPNGSGWYNREIQHYTDRTDNAFVEDGVLKIVAKKEIFTDQGQTKKYTSARLNSKFGFTYGKVEVRAKLPFGVGTWPAIWTLGTNIIEKGSYWTHQGFGAVNWPACGEIDIMEHWGNNQDFIQSAMHTPSSSGNTVNKAGRVIPNVSTEFHVYSLVWSPESMIFSVDNVVHYVYNPPVKDAATWPFERDQFILLNVAILPIIDPSFSSSTMEIDYVRVYQENPATSLAFPKSDAFSIYPSPAQDNLRMAFSQPIKEGSILSLYQIDGSLVQSYQLPPQRTEFVIEQWDTLANGVYLLQLHSGEQKTVVKVLKE